MSNDTNDRDGSRPGASGGDFSERLRRLDTALKKAQADQADGDEHSPRASSSVQGMAQALRLASEFAAGVIVGSAIGWGLDWLFGTSPWGLIVFLLLGFVAGVLNVMRAAGLAKKPGEVIKGRTQGEMDPIHQFNIVPLFGEGAFAFTNSSLFMVAVVLTITLFLVLATTRGALVPGRWQSLAEMSYEFVANTVRQSAGNEGMRFFPLVFSLFMFVLFANLFGMIPYAFTVTSHIIVTFALAMLVITTVILYGFWKNGLHFLNLFVPKGIPVFLIPLVVAIEVVSFLSRPISLSVRLFANMLAGHITLKVFAGFVVQLAAALGVAGWALAVFPIGMAVALQGLELLVAFLQAYVFTILTCIYLNDAIHPGH